MNIFLLLGIGVAAAAMALLLRQYRGEMGLAVELAAGLALLLYAAVNTAPLIAELRSLAESADLRVELLTIVVKALGVCYLAQFGADLCRDVGESAVAGKIELVGKVLVLVLSLPLFRQIMDTVTSLFGR